MDGIRVARPSVFLINPDGEIAFAYMGRNDQDVPDTANLVRLVSALAHPRFIPLAPESGSMYRTIRGWDMEALPKIEKPAAVPELPAGEQEAIPLLAARSGEDGLQVNGAHHPAPSETKASVEGEPIALGPAENRVQ